MYSVLKSYGLNGLNGFAVAVEADVSGGLTAFSLVGLPDSAVRESADRVLAAIKNLGVDKDDIIFCGRQAIDGDTAQVGPQIAEQLHIPQVSYAEELKTEGDSVIVKRQFEDQAHMLKVKTPCLITALSELNEARYMSVGGIVDAYDKAVTVWGFDDLKDDLNPEFIGLKGSPTNVFQSFGKQLRAPGVVLNNLSADEAVDAIMQKLIERHII